MTSGPATLQSNGPLRRVPANAGQEYLHLLLAQPLLYDAAYQRGSVWGSLRRRNLIRSLLLGVPVGNVFLNTRPDGTVAVVDGRQRLETVAQFLAGQLSVPASWFPGEDLDRVELTEDGPYTRYPYLDGPGQARFRRATITVQRTDLATVAQERELFDLVNFGGLPQGVTDTD